MHRDEDLIYLLSVYDMESKSSRTVAAAADFEFPGGNKKPRVSKSSTNFQLTRPLEIPSKATNAASTSASLMLRTLPASFTKSQADAETSSRYYRPNPKLNNESAAVPHYLSDPTLIECIETLSACDRPKFDLRGLDLLDILKIKGVDLLPPSKTGKSRMR